LSNINELTVFTNFAKNGGEVMEALVWEPSLYFQGGHADAPKMLQPAPLSATNFGVPVEML
jgi:hypothetical protein